MLKPLDLNNCAPIGSFLKAHGVKGELVVELKAGLQFQNEENWGQGFVIIDKLPVPFFIEKNSVYRRNKKTLLLKFDSINTREQAQELQGCELYIPQTYIDENKSGILNQSIDNYIVTDLKHGKLGVVNQLIEIAMNPLIQLFDGEKEYLIPFNKNFVQEINVQEKTIAVKLPDGFLEIFE